MKVIVLAGGVSAERDVSLRSGECVANALRDSGHEVEVHDTNRGLNNLLSVLGVAEVVFPALHGIGGEDGTVQEFLEDHQIPFVGSGSRASSLCFDKYSFGRVLEKQSFHVPTTELVSYDSYLQSALSQKPHVLKPYDGGSSIDTFIIRGESVAPLEDIKQAFDKHHDLLLQELIIGHEITVPILDGRTLPVVEIIAPEGGEFDYENKYNGMTEEACPPRNISKTKQKEVQKIARKIHDMAGCRDLSRTDMIIAEDGLPYILETNTLPGMTDQSTLPRAAEEAGISMSKLCDMLVKKAVKRARDLQTVNAS